jgi:hypothetical protein
MGIQVEIRGLYGLLMDFVASCESVLKRFDPGGPPGDPLR